MRSALLTLLLVLTCAVTWAEDAKPEASTEKTKTKVEATPEANSDASKENSSYVLCRAQKQVRTIRVDMNGGSCKAVYTKEGKDEIVAKSGTPDLCYEVVNKIRVNLEKSIWKCKDVNPDRVSFTME